MFPVEHSMPYCRFKCINIYILSVGPHLASVDQMLQTDARIVDKNEIKRSRRG